MPRGGFDAYGEILSPLPWVPSPKLGNPYNMLHATVWSVSPSCGVTLAPFQPQVVHETFLAILEVDRVEPDLRLLLVHSLPDALIRTVGSDALTSLSTSSIRRELQRRQEDEARPACGSAFRQGTLYNTSLHIGALFLILFLSTLACSFPIIVKRFPRLPVPHRILFLSRHFGTGVLIATAFVHLLPTAFVSLTDPCLPRFWTDGYPAFAGLVAMISVFVVVGIEMFFATKGAGHVHGHDINLEEEENHGNHTYVPVKTEISRVGNFRHFRQGSIGSLDGPSFAADATGISRDSMDSLPLHRRSSSLQYGTEPHTFADTSSRATTQHEEKKSKKSVHDSLAGTDSDSEDSLDALHQSPRLQHSPVARDFAKHPDVDDNSFEGEAKLPISSSAERLAKYAADQRLLLQCLLLEAGILFHSVFIGMALSVAVGTPFIVLLIAISFHQTFEGLALGARIAALTGSASSIFPPSSPKPWLMALAYGCTTPIGQAIGLGVHKLYDPESQTGLLMVGIMNAISSGLLLFAGLVELLAEDFLSEGSYSALKGRRRLEACGAVVCGGFLMALVGAWA